MTDLKNGNLEIFGFEIKFDMSAYALVDGLKRAGIMYKKYPQDSDVIRTISIPKTTIDGKPYSVTIRYCTNQPEIMESITLWYLWDHDVNGRYNTQQVREINENWLRVQLGEPHNINHQAVYYYYDTFTIMASYFSGYGRDDTWRSSAEIVIKMKNK